MRLIQYSSILSCCALILFSDALPYSSRQSEQDLKRRKAPYSVVPVDGGQSEPTPPPKTEVVTVESTRTVTQSPHPPPPVTQTVLATITTTPTDVPTETVSTEPEVEEPPETIYVTTTHVPKMTPYDDGMWRTTYYKVVEASPSSVSVASAIVEDVSPSSALEPASSSSIVASPSSTVEPTSISSTVEPTSTSSTVETASPSSIVETASSSSASSTPTDVVPPSPLRAIEIPTGAPSNGTYVFVRRGVRRPDST